MKQRLASVLAAAALTLSPLATFAVEYTPSAQNNDGPTARTVPGDTQIAGDPVINQDLQDGTAHIQVTSWSQRNAADTPSEVTDILNDVYADMKDSTNEELFPELSQHLEELKAENPQFANVTASDMKVSDLIDISVVNNASNTVMGVDGSITMQLNFGKNSLPFLMYHNVDTNKWEYVPTKNLGNGIYEITLPSLSPMAVLTPAPLQVYTTTLEGDTTAPVTPASDTTKPAEVTPVSADTTKAAPAATTTDAKAITANANNTTYTAQAETTAEKTEEASEKAADNDTTGASVATASNSNYTLAAAGVAVGLAGAVLILKARKSLAR